MHDGTRLSVVKSVMHSEQQRRDCAQDSRLVSMPKTKYNAVFTSPFFTYYYQIVGLYKVVKLQLTNNQTADLDVELPDNSSCGDVGCWQC